MLQRRVRSGLVFVVFFGALLSACSTPRAKKVCAVLDTGGENETTKQKPGNVCYVPGSQNVCIFCEDLPGLGPCSLIGTVTENLEGIQDEARKCKSKQGAYVEIFE